MSRQPGNLEAHIIFCPTQDVSAQIRAGEYIASLQPSEVLLGTMRNTHLPDTATFQEQGFYDAVTGYDNPNSLAKQVRPPIPGSKSYSSIYELLVDQQGVDQTAMQVIDHTRKYEKEIQDVLPYYHTVMQLRGTGVPFLNVDLLGNEDVFYGQTGLLVAAAIQIRVAEAQLFTAENGVDTFLEAFASYRNSSRQITGAMRKSIIRGIKQMPSRAEEGDKLVVITDNPNLYDLRKQQPSKRVATCVKSFASRAIVDACGGNKQVLAGSDYEWLLPEDTYFGLSAALDKKLGWTERLIGIRLLKSMLNFLDLSEQPGVLDVFETAVNYIDNGVKCEQFARAMQSTAKLINQNNRKYSEEDEPDKELIELHAESYMQKICNDIQAIVEGRSDIQG